MDSIDYLMACGSFLKTQMTNEIRDESSTYVLKGLEQVHKQLNIDSSVLSNKIKNCSSEADFIINRASTYFSEILEKANVIEAVIDEMKNELLWDANNFDELREQYESTIIPVFDKFLTELNRDSILMPLKVKKCVDSFMPLFHSSDTQFNEMPSDVEFVFELIRNKKKKFMTHMQNESFLYLDETAVKVDQLLKIGSSATLAEAHDIFLNKLYDCNDGSKTTINAEVIEFIEEAENELNDISDKSVDLIDYLSSEQFESTIEPPLLDSLIQLRLRTISVPLDVKTCVESFSQHMQSFCDDYSQLSVLQGDIKRTLERVKFEKNSLMTIMQDESLSYVLDGLENFGSNTASRTQAEDENSNKIKDCMNEADSTINAATIHFVEIVEKVNLFLDAIDEIKDDLLYFESVNGFDKSNDLKVKFNLTIAPTFENFLMKLASDSVSIALSVQICVERLLSIAPLQHTINPQFNEMLQNILIVFEGVGNEMQNLMFKMQSDSVPHMIEGLNKVKILLDIGAIVRHDVISSKIKLCAIESDVIVNAANVQFLEIFKMANQIMDTFIANNKIEIIDKFSIKLKHESITKLLHSKIVPALEQFTIELKRNSNLGPLNVKKCIDQISNIA